MQKPRIPTWALIWFAALALVMVVIFANKGAVDRIFEVTGIARLLYPDAGKNSPSVFRPQTSTGPAEIVLEPGPSKPSRVLPLPSGGADDNLSAALPGPDEQTPEPTPTTSSQTDPSPTALGKMHGYQLFFLKLGPDGRMEPTPYQRELVEGATPLTATLRALLQGPTLQDKDDGALTLIPEGTKLVSIRVKDRTAFLSFSDEFQHNIFGMEGLAGQLRQIIWTATQFSSIDKVQILINGQYRDSLGEEGLSIAQPLTRTSFR